MDPPSLDKVFHQELIRRSLIAISQLDPDTILSSEKLPDQSTSAVLPIKMEVAQWMNTELS